MALRLRRVSTPPVLALTLWLLIGCQDAVAPPPPEGGQDALASIAGVVRAEGTPVEGVVMALGDTLETVTGSDGRFLFDDVPLGTHRVLIARGDPELAFTDSSSLVVLSRPGEIAEVDFDGVWIRTSVIKVSLKPPFGQVSVRLEGPEVVTVFTDEPYPGTFGSPYFAGYKVVRNLRAGTYVARLLSEPSQFVVVEDSVEVFVGRSDTASVSLTLAPLVQALAVGDSFRGPSNAIGDGFTLPLDDGDTVDVRFVGDVSYAGFGYGTQWRMELYTPWRRPTTCEFHGQLDLPYYSPTPAVYIWKKVTRTETQALKILISFGGDLRGGRARNYSVMTRRSRPYEAADSLWNCGPPPEPRSFDCALQSKIPAAECQALKTLYFASATKWKQSDGWLSDPDPCTWFGVECDQGSVSALRLSDNGLVGGIPPEIAQLSGLRTLDLMSNRLTGRIPAELGSLSELRILYLAWNNFGGPIPPELGNLSHLVELDLRGSYVLSGGIPPELGRLENLERLILDWNALTGAIPPELASLGKLRELSLANNSLSGVIPPDLGSLSTLASLNLEGNRLTGSIPPSLGDLADLRSLNLARNKLSGPIPSELGSLLALESLYLLGNRLSGVVPLPVAQLGGSVQAAFDLDACAFAYRGESSGLTIPGTGGYVDADLDGDGAICFVDLAFPMAAVVVNPGSVSLLKGGEQRLTATAIDVRGEPLRDSVFAWSSTDPAVVAVSYEGLVTGLSLGTATITASTGGFTGTAIITVVSEGTSELGAGLGLEQFVLIQPGTFEMGSTGAQADPDEGPVHTVNITNAFYLQRTEVTQWQWRAVMGRNPSWFNACGDLCPVDRVSWEDVQTFLTKLNAADPGAGYRLPTEAEWEYAARAGTTTDYGGTGVLDEMGWVRKNSGENPHPVAQKAANAWGLYDMHGNASEWVQDWYANRYYGVSPANDPTGPATGILKVYRGGSSGAPDREARSSYRDAANPSFSSVWRSLRLVRAP